MTDAPVPDPSAYTPPKVWTWNKERLDCFVASLFAMTKTSLVGWAKRSVPTI